MTEELTPFQRTNAGVACEVVGGVVYNRRDDWAFPVSEVVGGMLARVHAMDENVPRAVRIVPSNDDRLAYTLEYAAIAHGSFYLLSEPNPVRELAREVLSDFGLYVNKSGYVYLHGGGMFLGREPKLLELARQVGAPVLWQKETTIREREIRTRPSWR